MLENSFNNIAAVKFFGDRKEGVARLKVTKESAFKNPPWNTMINDSSRQKWDRLAQKHLDTKFLHETIEGLSCSPYEVTSVLDSVYKIFAPIFEISDSLKPGQILFQVLSIENRPSVPLAKSKQITVTLTLDDTREDLPIRKERGVVGLRCHRIERICSEAFQQECNFFPLRSPILMTSFCTGVLPRLVNQSERIFLHILE